MSSGPGNRRLEAVAVIPARHASTRLPGKPLLRAGGRSLIEHVHRQVRAARRIGRVVVATDDLRIVEEVRRFGGEAAMTGTHHRTGSDRIGELLPALDAAVILNVQGDEPGIEPETLDQLVEALEADEDAMVATAAAPMPPGVDPADPNRVKVVLDRRGRALYFSRAPIPAAAPGRPAPPALLHLGVYAYRREALECFLSLEPGRLESIESLEQLRLLENGVPVTVVTVARAARGIDTPADFEAFRREVEGRLAPAPPPTDHPERAPQRRATGEEGRRDP